MYQATQQAIIEGHDNSLGVVWGRWTDYTKTGAMPIGGMAFITAQHITTGSELTALGPITATYSFVGATAPMNLTGAASGSITGALALVNFSASTINYSISGAGGAAFGTWVASTGVADLGDFKQGDVGLSGTSTTVGSIYGAVGGAFVGTQAQGLISGYTVYGGGNRLNGVVYMKK